MALRFSPREGTLAICRFPSPGAATVSLERLSMAGIQRRDGKLQYCSAEIDGPTLRRIREALAYLLELF